MGQPYVGEIRMFAGNFAPNGWMFCEGQTLPISENDVLFQLIGTTYGGDGEETFNLPNLQGRVPIHQGTNQGTTFQVGEAAGVETVTLNTQQIPQHNHVLLGSTGTASTNSPANNVPATSTGATVFPYGTDQPTTTLHPSTIGVIGGSQPHDNFQPYLCVNFIISLFGIFPTT
jgi:microcystin-dependent protein